MTRSTPTHPRECARERRRDCPRSWRFCPRPGTWSAAVVVLLLLLAPALLHAQPEGRLSGRWEGAITLTGAELRVELNFTRDGDEYRGRVSIPQQNAQNLPLTDIRQAGDSAVFTIQGVPGDPTFLGVFSADNMEISGSFRQAALNAPFRLSRVGSAQAAGAAAAVADMDPVIEKALADFTVPGAAVGVLHRGRAIYARGFGVRDVANGLPVTPQTLFAIGSSTKAFTTFALGLQADAGRFDWDRPVREYLPGLHLWDPSATAQLTARDMVTHRSGLPRHDLVWYNNRALTADDLFRRLRHFEPNKQLREQWQYNNIMYILAGHLLGEISGTSWAQAIEEQVFQPLGMHASSVRLAGMLASPDHALPYRQDGDTLVLMPFRNIDNVGPAGSINSNIDDMLKWAGVHVSNGRHQEQQLIHPTTIREMHTPQMVMPGLPTTPEVSPSSYGLGWMIQTYRGRYRVQHGGNIDGFSALVTLFPRDQLAVIVLTNANGTPLPSLITDHVVDRALELPQRDWLGEAHTRLMAARAQAAAASQRLSDERVTGTKPALPLAAYAGTYSHPGYGTVTIRHEDRRLIMTFNEIVTPLEHWHYEVFSGLENPADRTFFRSKLHFANDVRGRIAAVSITMDGFVPPIRFERDPDAQLRDVAYLQRLAGRYNLPGGGQLIVTLRGDRLVLEVPGQPPYPLDPDRNDEFTFAAMSGYSVRFIVEADGSAEEVRLIQPNGVFVATRAS
jgi:CubicO group peptidase (beta-lactamase class C family)